MVPEAYQAGRLAFMGLDLEVAPGALVPRPETELLGWTAVRLLSGAPGLLLIDMCCGVGNLACGLARALPQARVLAADISPACAALARRNSERLGLHDRIDVRCGDLFAPFSDLDLAGRVDAVVCNPPYISTGRLLGDRAGLLQHEPREAFDGGPFGIAIQKRVVREALPLLSPGGLLLFEVGEGQQRQVEVLFERAGGYLPATAIPDAAGVVRVVMALRR
jgi:HemK-like putative methylase